MTSVGNRVPAITTSAARRAKRRGGRLGFDRAMRITRAFILVAAITASPSWAAAASITLSASHDATIFENNPDNGSGAGNGLFAGTNGTSSPRRALVAFDLSAIRHDAAIQSVELTLYLGQV